MNLETETEEFWIKLFRFVKSALLCTVLEIRVNPKKNAPKVSKAPKFEF